MPDTDQEQLARRAAERSHARKSMHVSKIELLPHIASHLEQIENLRALTEMIAIKNKADPNALVLWLKEELFRD